MTRNRSIVHSLGIAAALLTAFAWSSPVLAGGYGYSYGYGYGHHGHYGHGRYGFGIRIGSGRRGGFYGGYHRHYPHHGHSGHYPQQERRTYNRSESAVTIAPEEAWALLKQGRPAEAVVLFGRLAEKQRKDGRLKAGYSLASAAAGDLERGVVAMRRAFSIDAEGLHYLDVDTELETVIDDLIARYEDTRDNNLTQTDANFMAAALNYLLNDPAAARTALDEDDGSHSADNLKRVIAAGS